MNFFKNSKAPAWIKAGKKIDSTLSLIFSILLLLSTPLMLYKINLMVISLVLFFITFYEMFRGLQSDSPKLAKIARIILYVAGLVLVAMFVLLILKMIVLVFGGSANG